MDGGVSVNKELFEKWIQNQNLSEVTINNNLRGIRYTERDFPEFLLKLGLSSIYELNNSKIIDNLLNEERFVVYDKKGNRMCSSGLKKYKEFLNLNKEVSKISEDGFRQWMKNNTSIIDMTIGSYISALRGLREPLKHHSNDGYLDIFKIISIDKIDEIMQDEKFKELDKRWNQAHTAALKYYKKYLVDIGIYKDGDKPILNKGDVLLIKIGKSYYPGISAKDLYQATSVSWVAKLEKRDVKYFCAVIDRKIIEVYKFINDELDVDFEAYIANEMHKTGKPREQCLPPSNSPRYIFHGEIAEPGIRNKLINLDVSSIHKGSGNPIKYTSLDTLLQLKENPDAFLLDTMVDEEEFHEEAELQQIPSSDLIQHIHSYIISKGFNYTQANIKNLYLSLRSKPFVIISGISGTGKTKIVQLFAESIGATEDNGQFTLIPVRPDWSDGSELLGYTDIKGDFIEGPLTKVVREASDNLDRPYFVLLDEMNLARVEYYFSDVLSIMESRKKVGDTYSSSTLITIDEENLSLPSNVYIIGTVNMDETTHPFSKKVLDRANTIEFNEIYLDSFAFLDNPAQVEPVHLANSSIEASYVQIQDCFVGNEQIVRRVSKELTTVNAMIEPLNAHVGYRVRDEICFYMVYNSEGPLFDEAKALDYCIMQKILPRLAGSGQKVKKVLEQLFEHFTGDKYENEMDFDKAAALYPLSAKKVYDMLGRLGDEGFTSFWIS